MSDINIFEDSSRVPRPKHQIHIEKLEVLPYEDLRRVRVTINVTPFLERPNLLLVLKDTDGVSVSELSIIETMHAEMEFTIHIRGRSSTVGDYSLEAELFYETRTPPQDKASCIFRIQPEDAP